jgi:DNA repair exonuclease SbcCD ATPase subunit
MERDLKCMYCAEAGITNTDVFIEIVDEELGVGWICKECFIESEKEKEEHLKELEQQLKRKEQECEELKEKVKKYGEINEQETKDYAELKSENKHLNDLLNQALKELEELQEGLANG